MACKCICSFLVQSAFLFSLFALALLLIPNLPPYASFRESYEAPKFRPLEGKLALNEGLQNLEFWHEGEIDGPEAFAALNGQIYTGLITGDIVKLTGQHITPIVKTGRPCRGRFEERICGRPLGMQFDKHGTLYVADAYYGILKVDVKTGKKEVIVSPDTKIEGKEPKIFNALAVASNGDIYWTDSSTNFHLDDGVFDSLADASGRLVQYDARTKQNKVLIDKIRFANGVALSEDESQVLVTETFSLRVLRYYLKGPKAGTHDVFVDRLPGYPDNVNLDGKGGYLLPLIISADDEHPQMLSLFAPFPLIRKFIARLFGVTQMIFEMLDRAYPNDYCLKAIHAIGHFGSTRWLTSKHRATIVHVSKTGEILDSIHTTRELSLSEAFILKDTLYTGSPFESYVGRIKLSELGWGHLAQTEAKKQAEQPKPAVKQETTTSKPTTQKQSPPPTERTTAPPPTTQKPTPTPQATTPPPPVQKEARQAPPVAQQQAPPVQQQTPPAQPKPAQVPPQQQKPSTPPPVEKPTQAPPVQKATQTPPKQEKPPQPKPNTPPPTPEPVQTPQKQDPSPQVKPTQAPPKPTQAPPKPTQAPPKPTQAPPKPSEAPSKPTQAPPKPSEAPPKPTQAPPKPSEAPPKPTQAPPKPSEAPTKPTQVPPKPTQAPPKPSEVPPKPTQAPPNPTQAPPKPTQAPPKPSQAPPKPASSEAPKEQTKTVPVKETVKTR